MTNAKITIPEIPGLYQVKPEDFHQTREMYGRAFREDPIWKEIMKDAPEKFPYVFSVPVKYALRYGKIFASSDNIEAAATWFATPYTSFSGWGVIRSGGLFHGMKLGGKIGKLIGDVFKIIEKDKRERMTMPFVYLMILGTDPAHRGKGLGSTLVKSMIEALPPKIPLYLETESEYNVSFYERLGFEVVKDLKVPILDLPMWEMLHPGN